MELVEDFPQHKLIYTLCYIGVILLAWMIVRLLRTNRSTQFVLSPIVQVCIILPLSFISLIIGVVSVISIGFVGNLSDAFLNLLVWTVLVGGPGISILLGCAREKKSPVPQVRRLTIFVDDQGDTPAEDVIWVQAWLDRWKAKVHVADHSSGGWEHLWDVEGPEEAIAEVPERLHCCSEWANPNIFGDKK